MFIGINGVGSTFSITYKFDTSNYRKKSLEVREKIEKIKYKVKEKEEEDE